MALDRSTVIGPYRIERLIGRGGMAVVYEAIDEALGRRVALKLLAPEVQDADYIERFRNEGRMQAALDDPHIVTIYESGDSEHGPYLAMQLIEGTTLAGLIDDGALDAHRTVDLLGQIASALDAAHAAGYVHRDVKPRNILIDNQDHAYLADFGLARHTDTAGATLTGAFMGTLAYIAPEVIHGEPATPASDRYALAAVLFECLTGTVVFPRPTHAAVLYAHTSEPPPRISGRRPEAPAELDAVLTAGLAKAPTDRPATATELVDAARAAIGTAELGPPAPRSMELFASSTAETTSARVPVPPPGRADGATDVWKRGRVRIAVLGATAVLVAGAVAAGTFGILAARDEAGPTPAGMIHLGSTLSDAGRTLGCDGKPRRWSSPNCTLMQNTLRDTALVVPRDGVIRRWSVRSASGELAVSVLRPRDNDYFQIARSRNEFVNDAGVQHFATDLLVEEGDRIALVAVSGSGIGVADNRPATTERWIPAVKGLPKPHTSGLRGEILLGADLLPGGTTRAPKTLTGSSAASAPAGTTLQSRDTAFTDGTAVRVRLAKVGEYGVLDMIQRGKRVARAYIPDMTGEIEPNILLDVWVNPDRARQIGIWIEFRRSGSTRVIGHYFDLFDTITYVD